MVADDWLFQIPVTIFFMAVATMYISGINNCVVIDAFPCGKKVELMIRGETGTVLSATKGDIWKFIH